MALPPNPQQPTWRYVNRVEVQETYADSLHSVNFDGLHVRFEFCVNRVDAPTPGQPPTGDQVTVCRVVMPAALAFQLMPVLQQIQAVAATGMPPGPQTPPVLN